MSKSKTKILFLCLLFLFTSLTSVYAWFSYFKNNDVELNVGTFDVEVDINLNNMAKETILKKYYDEQKDSIVLDGGSATAENSISNLNVNIKVNAKIKGYLRIKLKDEWIVKRTYKFNSQTREEVVNLPSPAIRFNILTPQNFKMDTYSGYIYYIYPISKGTSNITLIDGGTLYGVKNNNTYSETCRVNFNVSVELIQINRYKEVWGIESFDTLEDI